jgi:hypothetical protein
VGRFHIESLSHAAHASIQQRYIPAEKAIFDFGIADLDLKVLNPHERLCWSRAMIREIRRNLKFRLMELLPDKGWRFFNDPDFLSDHNPDFEPVNYDPQFGEIFTILIAPGKEFRVYLRCPLRRLDTCRVAMDIDKILLESAGVLLVEDENNVFVALDVQGRHLKIQVQTHGEERFDVTIQQEQMLELGSEVHEIVDLLVHVVYTIVDKNNAVTTNTSAGQQLHQLRR